MLVQQLLVLGNIAVVEIGYTKIEQDVENENKVEDGEVKAILLGAHRILNTPVNSKNPERLHQEVEEKKQHKVGEEFLLHVRSVIFLPAGFFWMR